MPGPTNLISESVFSLAFGLGTGLPIVISASYRLLLFASYTTGSPTSQRVLSFVSWNLIFGSVVNAVLLAGAIPVAIVSL